MRTSERAEPGAHTITATIAGRSSNGVQFIVRDDVRFAVIGDYGFDGQPEADVAALVRSWEPDFVITTGDNNYDVGASSTVDRNIGKHYRQFIFPYTGSYGEGAAYNRFFPSLGNHD